MVVALAMLALAWYIRHPPHAEPGPAMRRPGRDTVRTAAARIPFCCYSSARLYASEDPGPGARVTETRGAETRGAVEHRDRKGRAYSYDRPRWGGQALVGASGGTSTGLIGFGVGVLGVASLVIQRIPMRIAVGTSHVVILVVTGVAVIMHLVEMGSAGISPPWNIIAVNATAVLFGGQLAGWLAGQVREDRLRIVLVVLLLGLTLVTLYRAGTIFVG